MFRGFESSLDYYIAHPELHEMSRGELFLHDESLYRSLLRDHTIIIAISEFDEEYSERGRMGGQVKPLSELEIELIVSKHETYNRNPSEAAKHLPYTADRIRRVWRNHELETIGRGNSSKNA
ncbi:MAG: hypothetical protein CMH62_01430 [Nanoarchaeota archaeon]|nr:hypothetical protein [Nanoarchaeota archaeon]|tara:strand:- start:1208 stop:1573 length:366 start_codon:yes stop_codon:yes gene_type:complete